MKINQRAILRHILPMAGIILATAAVHFLGYFILHFSALSPTDLAINYALLFLFFVASEIAVFSVPELNAKKKEFKRGILFRLVVATLFLLFSTENAPEPFLRALHFMVPFLGFTVYAFLRFRKLLTK